MTFLEMGGSFALVVNGVEVELSGDGLTDILFPAGRQHICLTDIRDQILDRSKADSFKKVLACAQTGWFLSQCIARAVEKLPITELEITTVTHVAIALLTYFFWWRKPQDVQTKAPIMISEDTFAELEGFRRRTIDDDDLRDLRATKVAKLRAC